MVKNVLTPLTLVDETEVLTDVRNRRRSLQDIVDNEWKNFENKR